MDYSHLLLCLVSFKMNHCFRDSYDDMCLLALVLELSSRWRLKHKFKVISGFLGFSAKKKLVEFMETHCTYRYFTCSFWFFGFKVHANGPLFGQTAIISGLASEDEKRKTRPQKLHAITLFPYISLLGLCGLSFRGLYSGNLRIAPENSRKSPASLALAL